MNPAEWRRIHELRDSGVSVRGIAERTSISRNTVRRALSLDAAPDEVRPTRGSTLDRVGAEIAVIIQERPNVTVETIREELSTDLSSSTVSKYVARVRKDPASYLPHTRSDGAVLPQYATSFVGRVDEVARLRSLLGAERLVTITGPGGVGKTRLAVHLADRVRRAYADGVIFVDLTSVRSADHIVSAIADAVGVGSVQRTVLAADEAVFSALADRRVLLVLDNCEHQIDAVADIVHRLLARSAAVTVLASSRERLSLPEEQVFVLGPLPLSHRDEHESGAIELFLSRARSVLGEFEPVGTELADLRRLVGALDGLPLAIELASTRLTVMSVRELADRLQRQLAVLTTNARGIPERHRSLVAALDESRETCTAAHIFVWGRLSVLTGHFDITLAEAVCADGHLTPNDIFEAISALEAKSLIVREDIRGVVWLRMLETVRQYGRSLIDEEQVTSVRRLLLRWWAQFARDAACAWEGGRQRDVTERLRAGRSVLRDSLDFALTSGEEIDLRAAATIMSRLWFLWAAGVALHEQRTWMERVSDRLPEDDHDREGLLATLGLVATLQGDHAAALPVIRAATDRAEATGNRAAAAVATHAAGLSAYFTGAFDSSAQLLASAHRAYAHSSPGNGMAAALRVHLGMLEAATGRLDRARDHFDAVHRQSTLVDEHWMRAYACFGLAMISAENGDFDTGRSWAQQAMRLISGFDDTLGIVLIAEVLATIELESGNGDRAAVLHGSSSRVWRTFGRERYGSPHWERRHREAMGRLDEMLGEAEHARLEDEGAALSASDIVAFATTPERDSPSGGRGVSAIFREAGLTPREVEIAPMVARGLSNRQIAEKLVLSPRTVEGHVEHILQKLFLTRRGEIAALLGARIGRLP